MSGTSTRPDGGYWSKRARIAPDGYARVINAPDAFGTWLRTLPLRPYGTPVKSHAGDVLHEGADARIALLDATAPHAVVDESSVDLTGEPTASLVSTVLSTSRHLTQTGHRLVGTRVAVLHNVTQGFARAVDNGVSVASGTE